MHKIWTIELLYGLCNVMLALQHRKGRIAKIENKWQLVLFRDEIRRFWHKNNIPNPKIFTFRGQSPLQNKQNIFLKMHYLILRR